MPALCRDCCRPFKSGDDCPRCGSVRVIAHPELFDLTIAHMDCDAFYASVEKRDNPALVDRPLIVGHAGGRGVVTTACYIARKYGPRSAMPMYKALELCPDAVVVPLTWPNTKPCPRLSGFCWCRPPSGRALVPG